MVAIESIQLRDNLYMRVDKYPYSSINPVTHIFEDNGIQYLFTLYMTSETGNTQMASCVLRDDCQIQRFCVHRDNYGKGYGTILLNYVRAFASTKAYPCLKLIIIPRFSLLNFFTKRGFTALENVVIEGATYARLEMAIEHDSKPIEVMSYRNGHDASLVDKINWIGNDPVRKPMFHSIIKFLAKEYGEECRQNACINGEITDDVIEQYGYDILTNVFDDADLETIISYCRINKMIGKDNERFKNDDEVIAHFNSKFSEK